MTERCSNCGTETDHREARCRVCWRDFLPSIELVGDAGTVRAAIGTDFGRTILQRAIGDAAAFASDPQFRIFKDHAMGWMVQETVPPSNPTMLNDAPIGPTPTAVADGDELSIGGKVGRIRIRLARVL
jgi:hypothetical protein